ncbi:MAG: hypothetical protein K0S08_2118 [Gammaproteobacteria bacterium]|jgi:HAD superfamily hydrolase (TIGR01490 family)|nr:hypothetical protein [Gammaproteobacteria bacterium]
MKTTKYYAFFDVDGTLLKGTPMLDFLKFFYQQCYSTSPTIGKLVHCKYLAKAWIVKKLTNSREKLNQIYYQCYQNQQVNFIKELGQTWYTKLKQTEDYCHKKIIDELKWHQDQGAEIVFVSGSFDVCLEPLANDLQVKHLLCTELLQSDGKYTGAIKDSLIGSGKARAIEHFLSAQNFTSFNVCYAYGDHISDLPMLKLVGNPRVVSGDLDLELWATKNQAPILRAA